MAQQRKYTVAISRDQVDGWIAEMKELEGVRTSARTLESLDARVDEAIAASRAPKGEVSYEWPREIMRALILNDQARGRATAAEEAARQRTIETAREFQRLGLSLRDVAYLLEISHPRVQQLVADAKTYRDGAIQRHDDDDGEMVETSRRYGGTIRVERGPEHRLDHVFGECKTCGAVGRWMEPSAPTRVRPAIE
jgi:hypothetical protein